MKIKVIAHPMFRLRDNNRSRQWFSSFLTSCLIIHCILEVSILSPIPALIIDEPNIEIPSVQHFPGDTFPNNQGSSAATLESEQDGHDTCQPLMASQQSNVADPLPSQEPSLLSRRSSSSLINADQTSLATAGGQQPRAIIVETAIGGRKDEAASLDELNGFSSASEQGLVDPTGTDENQGNKTSHVSILEHVSALIA